MVAGEYMSQDWKITNLEAKIQEDYLPRMGKVGCGRKMSFFMTQFLNKQI